MAFAQIRPSVTCSKHNQFVFTISDVTHDKCWHLRALLQVQGCEVKEMTEAVLSSSDWFLSVLWTVPLLRV